MWGQARRRLPPSYRSRARQVNVYINLRGASCRLPEGSRPMIGFRPAGRDALRSTPDPRRVNMFRTASASSPAGSLALRPPPTGAPLTFYPTVTIRVSRRGSGI